MHCGRLIKVMCFLGTGYCSDNCRKGKGPKINRNRSFALAA